MPQKLALRRVIRDNPKVGEHKLALFGKIMQQRTRQQQTAVDDLRVKSGEKIRRLQHIVGMHQKAGQKAVVHAFACRNAAESIEMALEHALRNTLVVLVSECLQHSADVLHGAVCIDGRDRHERRQIIMVGGQRKANPADGDLRHALEI